jgi:hypothetical protein
MTILMSISLLSIGVSFGLVIAGILNKSDAETNVGSARRQPNTRHLRPDE